MEGVTPMTDTAPSHPEAARSTHGHWPTGSPTPAEARAAGQLTEQTTRPRAAGQPRPVALRAERRHPARRSRIAAVGVGLAAMAGLVSNMELAGRSAAAAAVISPAEAARRHAEAYDRAVAAALRPPIALTPHVIVHTVTVHVAAPVASSGFTYAAAGGYSSVGSSSSGGASWQSSSAVAAAPAPAAPVASTGGSHP
jgi:hypothetical protein